MTSLNVTLHEWQAVGPGTSHVVPGLVGFRFESPADRQLAEALTKASTLGFRERYDGLQIGALAHVGRIKIGRLTVTVLPKVGSSDLLALVRYAYGLRDVQLLTAARYATSGDLLQDLLIAQLSAETKTLLERGLLRTYVGRHENLTSPRGRIDFARLAVQLPQAVATLPCHHHPRDSDHVLNRALLAGLQYASSLAQDRELRLGIARLQAVLAELTDSVPLTAHLLRDARRKLNRLVAPYASILELVELLYRGNHLDLEADEGSLPLSGFLFNMNLFFQRLLERFLGENLPPPLRVESEHGLSNLMRYLPDENPRNRQAPTPRPDYAIRKNGQVLTLLDAKYRDLWETSLPRDMLYQLSIYALSQPRGSVAAILYPTTDPAARPARIEIRNAMGTGTAAYVALRPVLLARLVELVHGQTAEAQRARTAMALELSGLQRVTEHWS